MKQLISFLVNNWDLIGALLSAILFRFMEKPIVQKKAKVDILEKVIDESTMPDSEGKSRSISDVIIDALHSLRKNRK